MEEIKNIFKDSEFNLFTMNICNHIYKHNFIWNANDKEIPDIINIFEAVKYKDAEDLKNYKDDPHKLLDDPPIWFFYHNIYKLILDIRKPNTIKIIDTINIINDFFYFLSYCYLDICQQVIKGKTISLLFDILELQTNINYAYRNGEFYCIIAETKHFYVCKKMNKKYICHFNNHTYTYYDYDDTDNKIIKIKKNISMIYNFGSIFIDKYYDEHG